MRAFYDDYEKNNTLEVSYFIVFLPRSDGVMWWDCADRPSGNRYGG